MATRPVRGAENKGFPEKICQQDGPRVEVLATKSDNLSAIPHGRTELTPESRILISMYMPWLAHVCTHKIKTNVVQAREMAVGKELTKQH